MKGNSSKHIRDYCFLRDHKLLHSIVLARLQVAKSGGETLIDIGAGSGVEPRSITAYAVYGNRKSSNGITQHDLLKLCKYLSISVDLTVKSNV